MTDWTFVTDPHDVPLGLEVWLACRADFSPYVVRMWRIHRGGQSVFVSDANPKGLVLDVYAWKPCELIPEPPPRPKNDD